MRLSVCPPSLPFLLPSPPLAARHFPTSAINMAKKKEKTVREAGGGGERGGGGEGGGGGTSAVFLPSFFLFFPGKKGRSLMFPVLDVLTLFFSLLERRVDVI